MITIPEREEVFKKLKQEIDNQIQYCHTVHPKLGSVEVCVINTPTTTKGGPTIGRKRQKGLEAATGKYVMWLDDDDHVSPGYVETVLRLCNQNQDVCTFNNFSRFDNFWCVVIMDITVQTDEQAKPGIISRRPYHICAWKRELIQDIEFPDSNWDEDTGFIAQALQRVKTQARSGAILHEYNRLTKSYASK